MTPLERDLVTCVGLLESKSVPYMVVGGLAVAVWGEPRATLDIDITVWVPEDRIPEVVGWFAAGYALPVSEPVEFVRRTRVLPLRTPEGGRVDLIFGMLPLEEEAIRRARTLPVAGREIRFITPEDLILQKIVSNRDRDQLDVTRVAERSRARLDRGYLDPRVKALSESLEDPEIWRRYLDALN